MAELVQDEALQARMEQLGVAGLMTLTTDGLSDEQVDWIAPSRLRLEARRLRELVRQRAPEAAAIVASYANVAPSTDDVEDEIIRDLSAIEKMAAWAEARDTGRMTLYVSW